MLFQAVSPVNLATSVGVRAATLLTVCAATQLSVSVATRHTVAPNIASAVNATNSQPLKF